jgi:Leucine-rich repeat (LRR) protein
MTDELLTYYSSSLKLENIRDPPFISLINESGLSFLSSLFNLTYLSLRYNKTTDQGLSHLSCLVNLSFLDIGKNSEISVYGLPYLFPLVNLVNLKLGMMRIIPNKKKFKRILSSKLVKLKNWDSVFESE